MNLTDYTVLYVDDDKANRIVFEQSFKTRFKIVTASSGMAALEVLAKQQIGVLITDQRMPEMSGNELLQKVREKHPEVVRVVLTAYSDLDPILRAVNEGLVARYIIKPWDRVELEQTLAWAVEAYAASQRSSELQMRLLQTERLATIGSIAAAVLHDIGSAVAPVYSNVERLSTFVEALPSLLALVSRHGGEMSRAHRDLLIGLANELPEMVDEMGDTANMLVALTTFFTRLSKEKQSGEEVAEVMPVLKFVLAAGKRLVANAGGTLTYEGAPQLPMLKIDPTGLSQVLLNLVTNAAHALHDAGKKPGGRVTINAMVGATSVEFSVADNGVGMPPDVVAKTGTLFFTTRAEGTGLGMAQCRRIVGKYGSALHIASTQGEGTTIRFTLEKA